MMAQVLLQVFHVQIIVVLHLFVETVVGISYVFFNCVSVSPFALFPGGLLLPVFEPVVHTLVLRGRCLDVVVVVAKLFRRLYFDSVVVLAMQLFPPSRARGVDVVAIFDS
jgi:hypothetical protein